MLERIEGGHARYAFDSLAELARYIDDTPRTWRCNGSVTETANSSWDLGAGYEASVKMARDGWLEGAKQAQETLNVFVPKSPAPDLRTDFYGHLPHVPRFCAGAPDSMIRHTTHEAKFGSGRVLTLYVPVNATAKVSATHMRNFGLGVAQYINQLETDGMRVELHGVICSIMHGKRWRVSHSWRIKSADQHLDLAVAAFSIGHPAMFRRLGFALRERCAAPTYEGYGQSVAAELTDLINPPLGAYILNGMRNAGTYAETPEQALEYITQQIDKALETPDAE